MQPLVLFHTSDWRMNVNTLPLFVDVAVTDVVVVAAIVVVAPGSSYAFITRLGAAALIKCHRCTDVVVVAVTCVNVIQTTGMRQVCFH